jgi:glycosyltransferase involved in cell wall biosynthesis
VGYDQASAPRDTTFELNAKASHQHFILAALFACAFLARLGVHEHPRDSNYGDRHIGYRVCRLRQRLAIWIIARCCNVISHIPGPSADEVEAWRQGKRSAAPQIERNYIRGAQYVVASSHAMVRMLTACCPSIAGRLSLIRHGVDLDRFQPLSPDSPEVKGLRRELGLSEGDAVVGFVGRLVPQKGLPYLLTAAEVLQARYGNLRFAIVGDGPLRNELTAATVRSGDRRFCFLGERSDVPRLLGLFDMLVVPSEWEPFGIVNLEAMAAARPVVAFDVDGIPEAVVHGETGLLVPHRDGQALASAIAQLLDDAPLRRRMGVAGRQRVEKMFDVRGMTRTIEAFYQTATCGAATPVC